MPTEAWSGQEPMAFRSNTDHGSNGADTGAFPSAVVPPKLRKLRQSLRHLWPAGGEGHEQDKEQDP